MTTVPAPTRLSIVIPAWNEEATIGRVVRETRRVLECLPALSSELIVVDNGSTDDTASRARDEGSQVVSESRRGYGRACLAGIAAASPGDLMVFMDGDGSDDPAEIPRLIAPIQAGASDLVIGSRQLGVSEEGAHPWHAVFGTRLCVGLMNTLIGTKATDLGPFRAISAGALARIGMTDPTYGWTTQMQINAHRARLRTVEVPVNYRRRRGGDSKISGSWPASVRAGSRILGMIARMALTPAARPARAGNAPCH